MRRAAAATAAVALLLAGCSGGQAPTPSEPTNTSPTPAASTSTPQPSGTATGPTEPSETASVPTTSPPPGSSAPPVPDVDESLHPWLTTPSEQDTSQAVPENSQEITGVRVGLHDGYDRVVLDLSGDEPHLGWFAGFVDEPIEDPTGEPLAVEGDAFLQLGIYGIDWTTPSADRYSGASVDGGSLEVVEEVVFGGLFEAQQQILIGLDERTAYRMFALSDPARIVIDIRHG